MRVLIIGDTGTGKTFTSLSLSKFFKTVYYDVDIGTELWVRTLKVNPKIVKIRTWEDYKKWDIKKVIDIAKPELVVLDSLSELYEKYKDYVQRYIRETGKFPMPVATGVVDLKRKGIDTEFITIPMQMYALLYDEILNVVTDFTSLAENVIITMHPIETRVVAMLADGSNEIVHSSGKLQFLQGVYRKVDIILHLVKPMKAKIIKARGLLEVPENLVNPLEFLKELMGVENETGQLGQSQE